MFLLKTRLKPVALWSRIKHSTTEPLHSQSSYEISLLPNVRIYHFDENNVDPG